MIVTGSFIMEIGKSWSFIMNVETDSIIIKELSQSLLWMLGGIPITIFWLFILFQLPELNHFVILFSLCSLGLFYFGMYRWTCMTKQGKCLP